MYNVIDLPTGLSSLKRDTNVLDAVAVCLFLDLMHG